MGLASGTSTMSYTKEQVSLWMIKQEVSNDVDKELRTETKRDK